MYLVLIPEKIRSQDNEEYKAFYTSNIETVAASMRKYEGCKIYKLDSLTEVARIDVTMSEVTKEMLHG